jgi:radical SAM protein with 4Fe4S-binding SPASM domain
MIRGGDRASSHGPIRVQVEVTDKCNFDCIMCNRLTRPNVTFKLANDIDHANFTRMIDQIDPFYVTLNGLGEPALNKSIDKILIECRSRGIRTQMPSNMSIKKVMLEKIAPNPPGILTFSMHGATKETFEAVSVNSSFEDCIELFEAFLAKIDRSEVEVRILCALQARNLSEYAGFYDYLSKWNLVDKFVLVPVYDYGTGGGDDRRVIPSAAEIENALAKIDRGIIAGADPGRSKFFQNWRDAILQIRAAERILETGPCLVPWFSTYITAKGKVLPCCFLTDEDHVLGNIHEQDFQTIWNGEKYRRFRRQLREGRGQLSGCRTCPRNDAARLAKYNPLSLIPTQWRGNGAEPTLQLAGESVSKAQIAAIALTIKGAPIRPNAESHPAPSPLKGEGS